MTTIANKANAKKKMMSFRLTAAEEKLLRKAAKADGRTVTAEIEALLQHALVEWGSGQTHATMALAAKTIDNVIKMRGMPQWWDSPDSFELTMHTVIAILNWWRPPGEPSASIDYAPVEFGRRALLQDIQQVDLTAPFESQTQYQRWCAKMNRSFRPIGTRPLIWGESAAETTARRAETASFRDELVSLSQKDGASKDYRKGPPLTEQEAARMAELYVKVWEQLSEREKLLLAELNCKAAEETK